MSRVLLLVSACFILYTCSSAQSSCTGRCGESYFRGNSCQCDYECLSHNECCRNYESECTTRGSCKGRCGERFKRGRQCHCDVQCLKYDQCCPDYESLCIVEDYSMEEEPEGEMPTDEDVTVEDSGPNLGTTTVEIMSSSEPLSTDTTKDERSTHLTTTSQPTEPAEQTTDSKQPPTLANIAPPEADGTSSDVTMLPSTATTASESNAVETSSANTLNSTSTIVPLERASKTPDATTALPPTDTSPQTTSETTASTPIDESEKSTSSVHNAQTITSAPTKPSEVASKMPVSEPAEISSTNPETTSEPKTTTPVNNLTDNPDKTLPVPSDENAEGRIEPDNNSPSTSARNVSSETPNSTPAATQNPQQTHTEFTPSTPANGDEVNTSISTADLKDTNSTKGTQDSENMPTPHQESTKNPISEVLPTRQPVTIQPTTQKADITDMPSAESTKASMKTTPTTLFPDKVPEKSIKPKDPSNGFDENSNNVQSDANYDPNLCSGNPVNGLTTLRNGTIVVFRGHFFWVLDSRRMPGHAQSITDVWGLPSPIDTVFTRCNCQGKTYFFKGGKYWRFENDVMDFGFPKTINEGFGLRGPITAALSMPQYRSRRESVFFFKQGGLAQRYTYRVSPTCSSNKLHVQVSMRYRRATDQELGPEISLSTLRGFPSSVTSAISVPSLKRDEYKYYIFTKTKQYSLKMEGNTPVVLTPQGGPEKQKSAKSWFKCPNSVM